MLCAQERQRDVRKFAVDAWLLYTLGRRTTTDDSETLYVVGQSSMHADVNVIALLTYMKALVHS
jgi:hypothetical protein